MYEINPGGNRRVGMFYLINPDTGTHDVVITASGAVTLEINGVSASYTGVLQTGFPDAKEDDAIATDGTITTTVVTVLDNCWLAGIGWSNEASPSITAGANTTLRTNNDGTYSDIATFDSNGQKTPAGSYALACVVETNGYFMVASFGPSVAAGGSARDGRLLNLLGVG